MKVIFIAVHRKFRARAVSNVPQHGSARVLNHRLGVVGELLLRNDDGAQRVRVRRAREGFHERLGYRGDGQNLPTTVRARRTQTIAHLSLIHI